MSFDGKSEHYCSGGIEAIDVIEAYKLNFCLGNVIKYVLRCGHKGNDSDALRDLEKAKAYLEREIEYRKTNHVRVEGRIVDNNTINPGQILIRPVGDGYHMEFDNGTEKDADAH